MQTLNGVGLLMVVRGNLVVLGVTMVLPHMPTTRPKLMVIAYYVTFETIVVFKFHNKSLISFILYDFLGMFFAFWSLLKNDITYARMSRDMLLYILNAAVQNNGTDGPFGSENFPTTDRSRWWGEGFGLMYDWLQYWPSLLTTAGKITHAKRKKELVIKRFYIYSCT